MSIRIEVHDEGFAELRHSADGLVKGHADDMAERANAVPSTTEPAATEPYYKVGKGGFGANEDRPRYRVYTTGDRSAKHEAKTQALQRSL